MIRNRSSVPFGQQPVLKADALQRAILDSANFSTIATDAQGVIQVFNVGAERMLGYLAADVVNRVTPAAISDAGELVARAAALSLERGTVIAPGFEALVFKASRGMEDIYELTYLRKDGSRLPAIVSVSALQDGRGHVIGYLLIGTDNTARKRVETERKEIARALQETNAALELARATADKANRAKSEFLSSMSHELRTPLNAVLGFAQLMASTKPPPPPSQQRSLDQIIKAGWYLLSLINEILDLAAIESGKVVMSHEPMALCDVLRDCRAMIGPQALQRKVAIHLPDPDQPCFVHADRIRVKQVMINLLSNAIKYNRPGGSATVSCERIGAMVRVSVRDTGAGLGAEQIGQLFQPFNRLGQADGAEEGTGIGLVVTRQLVQLMGGKIGVDSEVGVGSTFWIELAASSAPELALPPAADEPPDPAAPSGQASTLLYVEDNPANLSLVEQLVARRSDIRLMTATDGRRGLELAMSQLPDVILLDINLPGISGYGVLTILQAERETAHIPVIALSANALPADIEQGLQAGFFSYLTKPINVVDFMLALDLALQFSQRNGNHMDLEEHHVRSN
ncbi:PAS domain-containing hybrid sensor histidine kinase/response regulator [Pseudoduganella namucuonensis]